VVDGVTNGLSYETDSCGVQNVEYEWLIYEWLVCSEIVQMPSNLVAWFSVRSEQ